MLRDGNDLAESQLDELVEYGTLRVVSAAEAAEEWEDVERAVNEGAAEGIADYADATQVATEAHGDPDPLHGDGHADRAATGSMSWDAGYDEDGASSIEVDWGDGDVADGETRLQDD
jgi:hypothetical protein